MTGLGCQVGEPRVTRKFGLLFGRLAEVRAVDGANEILSWAKKIHCAAPSSRHHRERALKRY
jgi:hypothetical protein